MADETTDGGDAATTTPAGNGSGEQGAQAGVLAQYVKDLSF